MLLYKNLSQTMQHRDLHAARWKQLSLISQMTNIGSEVISALQWRAKNNPVYAHEANLRALELFDLTLACTSRKSELTEISRARELWLDFFVGNNIYGQTEQQWKKYFLSFNYFAQIAK